MGRHYKLDSVTGELIEFDPREKKEVDVDAPFVIQDEMEPMQSMADCKYYTSKAIYRRSLREQGFIEVGNDVDGFKSENVFETKEYNRQLKEDMTRSWYEVRDGMAPLSELDKARCKRIDNNMTRQDNDRRSRDRNGAVRGR